MYLALVQIAKLSQNDTDNSSNSTSPSLPPDIHKIIYEEYPDVFLSTLPSGLFLLTEVIL